MQPKIAMEKTKNITRNALLAFVLVSIGFALGKEVTARRQASTNRPETTAPVAASDMPVSENAAPSATYEAPSTTNEAPAATNNKVVVYYLHTTFRCVTCNEIERLAKALVETEFADDLAAGRIEWREANFQQDESLAQRYEVVSSCVVVVNVQDGREQGFQRLDDVWTCYQNPADFNAYVEAAIRKYLS